MAERYLIDTSAVIKYLNETLSYEGLSFMEEVLKDAGIISFITEIELQAWNPPDENDLQVYRLFILQSAVLGVSEEIIQETIHVRKIYKLKLPDAIIAATAISNELTLISDNDEDFRRIPELRYINANIVSRA